MAQLLGASFFAKARQESFGIVLICFGGRELAAALLFVLAAVGG